VRGDSRLKFSGLKISILGTPVQPSVQSRPLGKFKNERHPRGTREINKKKLDFS